MKNINKVLIVIMTVMAIAIPSLGFDGNMNEQQPCVYEVQIDNVNGFNPSQLNLNPGDEIVWINNDKTDITLSNKEGLFEDKTLEYDMRMSYTFQQYGTYIFNFNKFEQFITIDPSMPHSACTPTIVESTQTTDSTENIKLIQHLNETKDLDNYTLIIETYIYKNEGNKDFVGTLSVSVPEGIRELQLQRIEMVMGGQPVPVDVTLNGNIASWKGDIKANEMPPVYALAYLIPNKSIETSTPIYYYIIGFVIIIIICLVVKKRLKGGLKL